MSITHLNSVSELTKILSQSKEKLSVIDFHATWCGPCHAIAPFYESLSKQHPNVNFLKCDVDAAQDVARMYSVTAMPTFVFLKGSTKVDQVRGADKSGLQNAIRKHSGPSTSGGPVFSGKGHTLGGGIPPTDITRETKHIIDQATGSMNNLDPQVKVLLGLAGLYLLFWFLS